MKNQKCSIKMFCIHIQRAFPDWLGYFSWSAHLMFMFTVQSLKLDNILMTVYSRKTDHGSSAPSWSFQQEVSECYDREKRKQVHADERPATAIQPVSQRTLSPRGSAPEESSRSACVQRKNHHSHQKAFKIYVDLRACRNPPVNIRTLFILVCFFLWQRSFALVSLSQSIQRGTVTTTHIHTVTFFQFSIYTKLQRVDKITEKALHW